jgi:hypothetical protein
MVISPRLLREIDEKKAVVMANPDYYLKMSNAISGDLRQISNLYSYWLENPRLRMKILKQSNCKNSRGLRRIAKKGINRMHDAWAYLLSVSCQGEDFTKVISPEIIAGVGAFVDPRINGIGFRQERVSLNFRDYIPPNYVKVPGLIQKMCDDLHGSDYHPVEAAASVHLDIAGIQPFLDGNKRTARLFQDKILNCVELPPAVIPYGERDVYLDLLEQGLIGRQTLKYELVRPFFDYVGGKVNSTLDSIIGDLHLS